MGTISLSIPQVGQPDSTEDPKVANNFTLLQTLLNGNLDGSNISSSTGFVQFSYNQMNSNAVASSGQWVVAAPSVTATLPAPSVNAIVVVTANNAVTSSTPVVVSGTNIYGLGLSAASSFKLGVPLATVVLESDGSSWAIISGMQDTGWVDIAALGANISQGTQHAQTRLRGDLVYSRGYVTSTNTVSGGVTILTYPSGQRPPATHIKSVTADSGTPTLYVATIATSGAMTLNTTVGISNKIYMADVAPFSVT